MSYKIVTKGVSFNVLDPDQKELLNHASKRRNFSSYIKRLIQRDIDNGFTPIKIRRKSNEGININFHLSLFPDRLSNEGK